MRLRAASFTFCRRSRKAVLANTTVSDEDLRSLADRRARAVRTNLIDGERVPEGQVFLVAPRLDADGIKDSAKPTRVDFALR